VKALTIHEDHPLLGGSLSSIDRTHLENEVDNEAVKGWSQMSKFIGMLPEEGVADSVTKELSELNIDDLDWSIIDDSNHARILPAFAWPGGNTSSAGGTVAPIGGALVTEASEETVLEDEGVEEGSADYYGQAIEHGGTAIIVEAPDEYDDQIRATLQRAQVSRITKE